MTTLPRLSEESEESFDSFRSNGPNTNFSRPRPSYHSHRSEQSIRSQQSHQSQQSHRSQQSQRTYESSRTHQPSKNSSPSKRPAASDRGGVGNVHTISAFHDSNRNFKGGEDFPDEPRFSIDSDTPTDPSTSSNTSEHPWDGRKGELRQERIPTAKYDQQRFAPRPSASRYSSQTSMEPYHQPQVRTTVSAARFAPGIVKRVSVDVQSERMSMSTDRQEDDRSHHTVSDEDGDSGSFDVEGNWQSSNYATTGLSDAEIRKLLKKGVNPSLYAEMKAAKKGKNKWVGPLLGNSFIG